MKDIRIGNDITIQWSLFNGDAQFPIEGLDLHVYLKDKYGRKEIEDFQVSGNQITWTFYGKDQRRIGVYSMEVVINEGEDGMITTDACQFVNLVPCTCKVSGADDKGVRTETIELTSTLEYVAGGGKYDDPEVKNELARLEREKADKSELTELSAEVGKKQDTIPDLETIRSGAEKGATALQSVPATYATKTDVSNAIAAAITNELNADF